MWFAIVILFFAGADGRLQEREFRSEQHFQSAQECLQRSSVALTQSLPTDERLRGYALACRQEETV
jgi:hypothetical protein